MNYWRREPGDLESGGRCHVLHTAATSQKQFVQSSGLIELGTTNGNIQPYVKLQNSKIHRPINIDEILKDFEFGWIFFNETEKKK